MDTDLTQRRVGKRGGKGIIGKRIGRQTNFNKRYSKVKSKIRATNIKKRKGAKMGRCGEKNVRCRFLTDAR